MSEFTHATNGVVLFKGRIYAPNDTNLKKLILEKTY